jgi:hypothetical protein
MTICYNMWSFGILFPFWYVWTKKNLATLIGRLLTDGGECRSQTFITRITDSGPQNRIWGPGLPDGIFLYQKMFVF